MKNFDGLLKITSWYDLKIGTILREVQTNEDFVRTDVPWVEVTSTSPQHPDSTILRVESGKPDIYVTLVRPHLFIQQIGSCTSWYVGVEEVQVEASRLIGESSLYRTVCLASGKPTSVLR